MKLLRQLVSVAIVLAMVVILLGAYTRLTDAGLGCPDWPGCYGMLQIPQQHHSDTVAELYPDRPLEVHKARNEMVHRYCAGTLGLLVAAIFFYSAYLNRRPVLLPSIILILVVFQAALGMWTVTLNLYPVVVMGHLLGGISLLALLWLYRLQLSQAQIQAPVAIQKTTRKLATVVLFVLFGQISLGGWTSANYAALACVELPICHAGWQQQLDFSAAFDLHLGHQNYEYGVMSKEARQTVHILHRLGAAMTASVLVAMLLMLWREPALRLYSRAIALLLLVQIILGIINVWALLPLANAVAHNFVAANLFAVCVMLRWRLRAADKPVAVAATIQLREYA